MHTFTKKDKEKLDIMWSLFWNLRSQLSSVFVQLGYRNMIYSSLTEMRSVINPGSMPIIFQIVDPAFTHQYYFDRTSLATADGFTIVESLMTTQGRFIQLL